jgi:hypothetical protein
VSTAVRHRTAGGTLTKLATVAAILIMTGTYERHRDDHYGRY